MTCLVVVELASLGLWAHPHRLVGDTARAHEGLAARVPSIPPGENRCRDSRPRVDVVPAVWFGARFPLSPVSTLMGSCSSISRENIDSLN